MIKTRICFLYSLILDYSCLIFEFVFAKNVGKSIIVIVVNYVDITETALGGTNT